jgi:hypothetical protein
VHFSVHVTKLRLGLAESGPCAAEQTGREAQAMLRQVRRAWSSAGPPCARQPPGAKQGNNEKVRSMLYTIAVVMIILWLLGLVTSTTMGGLIHVLLVIAIVMILVNLISGRRTS